MSVTDLMSELGIEVEPEDIIGVNVALKEQNNSTVEAGEFYAFETDKTWTSAAADDPSEGDGAGSGGVNTGGTEGEVITFTTDGNGYCLIALNQSVHGAELEEGVHYYLKEIDSPDGYTIDNSVEYWAFTLTKDADQVNYGGTNEDGKRQWIYYYYNDIMKIANSPTPTTVSVTKVWKDKNDNKVSWDQDVDSINLTLIRMKGETQDMEFGESGVMTLVVTATGISRISPELDGVTGSVALKTEGTPSDGYLVTLEGLPLTYDQEGTTHDYTYCFSEDQVANYNAPVYKLSSGGNVNDRVASGGSIENSPEEAYRLPATGGMGSWGLYLSGGLLVLAVGMILARRQRRLRL